ncbi:MAG: hypothetical protein ACYC6G_19315 [Desulfobaccales bacterium]
MGRGEMVLFFSHLDKPFFFIRTILYLPRPPRGTHAPKIFQNDFWRENG